MKLKIVKYGDPVLTREAPSVTNFDGQLAEMIENMFETMYAANGVGLAANQVAIEKKLFVMDCSAGRDPQQRIVCVNPQIVDPGFRERAASASPGCR
jgi:peptide deformylase